MTEYDQQPGGPIATRWSAWVDRHGLFAFLGSVCLALLLVAYSNHFGNGFHLDDSHVIVDNLAIRSLQNAPNYFVDSHTFSSYPQNAIYRPLLTLTYALDYWRGGGINPASFHRAQFGMLLALGAALVWFFKRLLDCAAPSAWNRYIALVAATLFSVHTANTETVNYISARPSLVATLAVVLAFLIYLTWPGGRRTYLYLLPVVAGGLATPLTVMFAPILFVFMLLFEEESGAHALRSNDGRRKVVAAFKRALPSFVVVGLLFLFLSRMNTDTLENAAVSRWDYLLSQPFVWLHYVRLFFLPIGLTADTDWKVVTEWYDTRLIAGVLFVVALLAGIARLSLRTHLRPAAFGLAWFCLALLPTSSIAPHAGVYNEHRIFFPYVGLSFAVTWLLFVGLRRLFATRPVATRFGAPAVAVLVVGLLVSHAVGTHTRNRVWKDDETLWGDVVRKGPANGRGLRNYGQALIRKGEFQAALDHFNRAVLLSPDDPQLEISLGVVKAAMGRDEEAEAHFLEARAQAPDDAAGYFEYAKWLLDHHRAHEAIRDLETAVGIRPMAPGPRTLLLRLYVAAGYEDKLHDLAGDTLALAPGDRVARAYLEDRLPFGVEGETAEHYRRVGRSKVDEKAWLDAAATLRHALQLDETSAVAWNNLGWARLKLGLPDLAAPCFSRAFELDSGMTRARNNLREAQRQAVNLRR